MQAKLYKTLRQRLEYPKHKTLRPKMSSGGVPIEPRTNTIDTNAGIDIEQNSINKEDALYSLLLFPSPLSSPACRISLACPLSSLSTRHTYNCATVSHTRKKRGNRSKKFLK